MRTKRSRSILRNTEVTDILITTLSTLFAQTLHEQLHITFSKTWKLIPHTSIITNRIVMEKTIESRRTTITIKNEMGFILHLNRLINRQTKRIIFRKMIIIIRQS